MQITALQPFGVEIAHVDPHAMDAAAVARIEDHLGRDGVVVLRGQTIDDDAFVAFLRRFGALTFTKGETPLAHQPALNFVTNEGRTTPPRSVFHTDTSYVASPPAYTALRGVLIPEAGGETVFANQFAAYETLTPRLKRELAGRRMKHEVTGVTLAQGEESATWHPIFRKHPTTGRTALFLSTPERCTAIEGMDDEAARETIRFLFDHSTAQPLYRHRWQAGDVVMWDNRCTLHKADHSGVVGARRMHRGMVGGEVPLAA